jgi:hypothetical protein
VKKSIEFSFACGSNVVSLIPTRAGNGALDALARAGEFIEPSLADLENAHEYGINLQRGRLFADTWDLERFARCPHCACARCARRERIHRMNLSQRVEPRIDCSCGD